MASYEKAKNGTWSVRFYFTENFETKQKRIRGFATKKEAERAYIDYQNKTIEEKNNKISSDATKLKFEILYNEFCNLKKSQLKESAYYDFLEKSNKHILPHFQNYLVLQISPKQLLLWQQSLEHYSYKYKSLLRTYLFGILKYAERYYKIPNQLNFVDGFKNKEESKEMQIWSEEEFNKFISSIKNIKYKALFSALFLTGCRKGELFASTWKDWDLENKKFDINKSVTRKTFGNTFLITSPKNKTSYRKITIPDNLVTIMLDYKKTLESPSEDNFVFGGDKPIPSTTVSNFFDTACKKAEVEKIRLHDFRHSHASYLIGHGISIVAVAKRLGHKDIEQTLNTYSHLIKEEDENIARQLNKINF